MSWWRVAASLGLSLGLHLAAVGLVRGRLPSLRLAGEPAPTTEIPLAILGGGERSPPRAVARPSERRSTGVGHPRGGRVLFLATDKSEPGSPPTEVVEDSLVAAIVEGPERATEPGDDPGPGADAPPGESGGAMGASEGRAGGPGSGSGVAPAIDLTPFVERLRHSAERCGSIPPRGRSGHPAHAPVGVVRFCVAPDGAPTSVSLVESTGDPALDRAAVECIVPGAAPLPKADYCLVVPLRFH